MAETTTPVTFTPYRPHHDDHRRKANIIKGEEWNDILAGQTREASTGSGEGISLELRPSSSSLPFRSEQELSSIAKSLNLELDRNATSPQAVFHNQSSGYEFKFDQEKNILTSMGHFDQESAICHLQLAKSLGYSSVRPSPSTSGKNENILKKAASDLTRTNPSSSPSLLPPVQRKKLDLREVATEKLQRIASEVGIEAKVNQSRQAVRAGAGNSFMLTRNGLTFNGAQGQKFDMAATTGASLLHNIRNNLKKDGYQPDSVQLDGQNPKGLNQAIKQKMQILENVAKEQQAQQHSNESARPSTAPTPFATEPT